MIELTLQEQQAVDACAEPRLIDPRNRKAYVLVDADVFGASENSRPTMKESRRLGRRNGRTIFSTKSASTIRPLSARRRAICRRRLLSTELAKRKCAIYSTPILASPSCATDLPPFGEWQRSPRRTAPFPRSPVTNFTRASRNAKIPPKNGPRWICC